MGECGTLGASGMDLIIWAVEWQPQIMPFGDKKRRAVFLGATP